MNEKDKELDLFLPQDGILKETRCALNVLKILGVLVWKNFTHQNLQDIHSTYQLNIDEENGFEFFRVEAAILLFTKEKYLSSIFRVFITPEKETTK